MNFNASAKEATKRPNWVLRFSRKSSREQATSASHKQRLPVTPAIWVIIWTSVMVGYAGGYSDGAGLLSHTAKPYRQLFFPGATEAATVHAVLRQQQLYKAGHPQSRQFTHHFTGIAWDISCQEQFAPPSLVLTWQFVANILVLPFAAWQARFFGRKSAVITGCCLQAVGVVLKALSWHLAQLAIGYAIEGLGRGILWLAIAIEDAEISPASLRGGFISCNLVGTALGFLSAVAVFWEPRLQQADYGWRVATALNALPATVVVLLLPWFSESPNSLIQRGKLAAGREALLLIRGPFYDPTDELMDIVKGAGTEPFVSAARERGQVQQPHLRLQDNSEAVAAAMADGVDIRPGTDGTNGHVTGTWGVRQETAAWFKLQLAAFKERQHYLPLLVSCVLAMLLSIVGLTVEYTLLQLLVGDWVFGPKEVFYTTMFVTAGIEAAGSIFSMCLVDWVGRRGLLLGSSLVGAICWAAFAVFAAVGQVEGMFSTLPSVASAIALLVLMMFAHILGPFMLLPIVATELHQLAVRTSAAAIVLLVAFSTRVMVISSVSYTMCFLQWRLFVLMAVVYVGVVVVGLLFLPETKKVPLERIGGVWQKHWLWKRWIVPVSSDVHGVFHRQRFPYECT